MVRTSLNSFHYPSRSERQKKRRKNQRLLYSLLALLTLSLVFFLLLIGKGTDSTDPAQRASEASEDLVSQEEKEAVKPTEDEDTEESFDEEVVLQYIDSEDENVIEAYVGNWPPIGTEQSEPHTTNFEDGSTDRKEIRKAVLQVTNIEEEDLVELWIGNGGEQKVIANVKDQSNKDLFRVHLSWVELEGWQVTLVEKLKEYTGP